MTIPQVKRLLGSPWRQDVFSAPGYPVLIFHERKLSVYFDGKKPRAVIVTTWNPAYRTAAGIGPCSTIDDAKRAYGAALRPSRWNTQHGAVYVYTMGDLLFADADLRTVTAVGLYDSKAPGAQAKGGALAYAGFVLQPPDQVSCS
jgi:hypothetical protein